MLVNMATEQADEQSRGKHFRLNEAATQCNVSRSTMRRRREEGAFPNAYLDSAGSWMIPLADLLAAGLKPGVLTPSSPQITVDMPTEHPSGHPHEQPKQQVSISLDEYKALLNAAASAASLAGERDGLARELARADDAKNEALRSAWAWHEQTQLIQRQLLPAAETVVDVRDHQDQPVKRRSLFKR